MFYLTSTCTGPHRDCPIDPSELGQYPDIADKFFSIAFFGICAIVQLVLGIKWRTWTYMVFTVCGSALEAVGYVGRLKLWANPLSIKDFEIQIICLVLAPAFLSAGVYLSLKHLILRLGPQHSSLKPEYYTRAFIAADIISLILQFAGGAIAGLGAQKNIGLRLALVGSIGQVVTLLVFGILVIDYAGRTFRNRNELSNEARNTCRSWRFRLYASSIGTTFVAILIRCIYRIPELTGDVRRIESVDETKFVFLDGVMIILAVFCLTAFHPGFFFPQSMTPAESIVLTSQSPTIAENTDRNLNLVGVGETTPRA